MAVCGVYYTRYARKMNVNKITEKEAAFEELCQETSKREKTRGLCLVSAGDCMGPRVQDHPSPPSAVWGVVRGLATADLIFLVNSTETPGGDLGLKPALLELRDLLCSCAVIGNTSLHPPGSPLEAPSSPY